MTAALQLSGLPAPKGGQVDLLVVAAEHSGDEHAARMVAELRRRQPNLAVCALGGPRLAAAGAQMLRDLTANSTMGFAVLGQLSYYRRLIADVVAWIGQHRPRAVCFVDSSGLNLRIAKQLCRAGFSVKGGGPTKALYYISPQIWASRSGRRFVMSRHLDGLASIFPFEPACYDDTGLMVTFVGHPFVAPDYVAPVSYDPAGPVLLLPGSRKQVVARIFPLLLKAYALAGSPRKAIVLYPSEGIREVLAAAKLPAGVTLQRTQDGPVAASAVLTASGTMSMHCALAGIPGALTYKTDALTYFLGRMIVQIEYIGIANLLLNEPMYPEFIQCEATPAALATELKTSLESAERREQTQLQAFRLRTLLSQSSDGTVADWMERQLG